MSSAMKAMIATVILLAAGSAARATSEADFKTAFAAADAAEKEAGRLRNRWTTTEAALAAAKKPKADDFVKIFIEPDHGDIK